MSGKRYSSIHKVVYYECDKTQKMTVQMLLNLLIQVSGEQSARLGLTDAKMEESGMAWIVLQHLFEINRMPNNNETIEVETAARQYNKFFCYRDFTVKSETGGVLVSFTMVFAIMDIHERKMIQISDKMVKPYEAPLVKKPIRNPRPQVIEEETADSSIYRVRYFDIDANDHVNNSKYIEWMFDMLGEKFLTGHIVKKGNIKFEKEILYGQPVECLVSLFDHVESQKTVKEKSVQSAHRIQTAGQIHCTASFEWLKNEDDRAKRG